MRQSVLRTFGKGLIFLLPIIICLYVLYWFFRWADSLARGLFLFLLPDFGYIPGMGILLACGFIYAIGVLISSRRMDRWLATIEMPFENVPIIKSIYTAIKDLTTYFAPSESRRASRVVVVKWPQSGLEIVGFLTRESLEGMPQGVTRENRVAVYLPMSYQIGGYTVLVPREWVKEVDISIEEAMRATLTAWLPGSMKE